MTDEEIETLIRADQRAQEERRLGITRQTLIAWHHLHAECAELFWQKSQDVTNRLLREWPTVIALRDLNGPLVRSPTPLEVKLQQLMAHRRVGCFRPYLEAVAKVHGVPWRSLLDAVSRA